MCVALYWWNIATFYSRNQDFCPVRNGGPRPWAAGFPFNEGTPLLFQCQGVLNSYKIFHKQEFLSFREREIAYQHGLHIFWLFQLNWTRTQKMRIFTKKWWIFLGADYFFWNLTSFRSFSTWNNIIIAKSKNWPLRTGHVQ